MFALSLMFALQAAATSSPAEVVDPNHEVQIDFAMGADFVKKYDKDGDGALNLGEFQDAMTEKLKAAIASNPAANAKVDDKKVVEFRDQVLPMAFRSLDKDSDGRLTVSELHGKQIAN